MQSSPDEEAQAPRAGQCHISDCFTLNLMFYISQFGNRDQGSYVAKVQIFGTNTLMEAGMERIPSPAVRTLNWLKRFLSLTQSDQSP
jgi:hypothetical protein